jgi:hypothetical protein
MKKELRDKFYGSTIEERLAQVPGELAIDAVGLWQIVSFGRQGFNLSGPELVDYVRRHILALLAKGAKPVVGARDNIHYWVLVDYGRTPDDIADAIVREWLSSGREPDPGDVWFALPHIYEATRPHGARLESGPRKRDS